MLLQATTYVLLFALATTLWMAFYLFARGFPRAMTMRVVIALIALSGFYFGAYNNIFVQVPGSAAIRAVLLVIGLGAWYGVTFSMMSEHSRKRYRLFEWGIYALGVLAIILLLQKGSFINEEGNALYVAHMEKGWTYRVYGIYQLLVSLGIMLNLLVGDRVGLTSRGRYFLVASIFPVINVFYGVISLSSAAPSPRIIQDALAFCGVVILGLAVARHQTLTERRTTLQDFPITTLAILVLTVIYIYIFNSMGHPTQWLSAVVVLVIFTHASYDMVREFLERLRIRRESEFRRQLRQLEGVDENAFKVRVQEILDLLCRTLNAANGFVAVRSGDEFIVTATRQSVPMESRISAELISSDDVSHLKEDQISDLEWIAPSFEGLTQVAAIALGKPRSRLEYSSSDLELLGEVADQIGTLVSLRNLRPGQADQLRQLVAESQTNAEELKQVTGEIMDTISVTPDADFIRMVEDGLRHLPDTITLGQSPLADKMGIQAGTHIERGKRLQQLVMDSIELLKPAEKRPPEPLPRIWYNYAVLHDAYVEGVQNREIMARLYISEGTFNRTRRNAIRGLARALAEM
jgi:hypothetical protein